MRWIILCLVLLLTACPGGKDTKSQPTSTGGGKAPQAVEDATPWPAPAVAYLKECLASPADDTHPPLGITWQAIARLPGLTPLAPEIGEQARREGLETLPELAGAWLAVDPAAAEAWLKTQFDAGDLRCLLAVRDAPDVGRRLLTPAVIAAADDNARGQVMDLLRGWGGAVAGDAPLLNAIAAKLDTTAGLRAVGYLLTLGPVTAEQTAALSAALQSKDFKLLVPATEAVKLSGDERWASELVPLVSQAEMGAETPRFTGNPQILFGSYALSFLPGEQAQLMRAKLLGAKAPLLRWQARLGELLHGDPAPWNTAVQDGQDGADAMELWMALEPPEVTSPELLATYEAASESATPEIRAKVAQHLNRYAGGPSQEAAVKMLTKLILDAEPVVQEQAWYSLGKLGQAPSDPLAVVENVSVAPAVRLAAAWCALELVRRAAAAGPANPR